MDLQSTMDVVGFFKNSNPPIPMLQSAARANPHSILAMAIKIKNPMAIQKLDSKTSIRTLI
jgi:hypothetical protein